MRKFTISLIFIVVLSTLFLVGCTPGVNEKEDQTNKEETQSNSSDCTENGDNNTDINSTKQIYLEKLTKLESDLIESLKEKYASPKTQDMIDAANKEYTEWDNMLNEIYTELEKHLSKEDMDQLRDSELNWIEERDKKAQEAQDEYNYGTIAPLSRIKSLANNTKSRCYKLVNQYMK